MNADKNFVFHRRLSAAIIFSQLLGLSSWVRCRYNGDMARSQKVTRRTLGAMLAAAGVSTQIAAAQAPAAQPARAADDPDLEAARQQARNNGQLISRVKLPMTTEPAFHFKA
jgi:hypothetical protein